MYTNFKIFLVALVLALPVWTASAEPSHGLALYGPEDVKYGPNEPFGCAHPDAPKGGILRMPWVGAYTKLNPFSLKGYPAPWVSMVFEQLMEGSPDESEPFTQYGLLAETVEVGPERMSVTYHLRPEARFSDGKPVTADDVVFSFNLIQDPEFLPWYKAYYADVDRAEKVDERTVTFHFKQTNQELPLIMGQLFILPKHIYGIEGKRFGSDFDDIAIGSGPYAVGDFDHSKHVTYRRDTNYWGRDLPRMQGRFNFDSIIFKIFLDEIPAREALKGGLVDARMISSSKDWALMFNGPYVKKGYLRKEKFSHNRVEGMQGFVFNTRRPIFADREVRKVLASLLDFEYCNDNLFFGQYTRSLCYWDNNQEMKSRGPARGAVRDMLLELRDRHGDEWVPAEAITRGPYIAGNYLDGRPRMIGERLRAANARLEELGWTYDREAGVRMRDGQPLTFEVMLTAAGWSRIVNPYIETLREAGIQARYRLVQAAEYVNKVNDFDFDILVYSFRLSESPGNEQRSYWHSEAADTPGSFNLPGIRNPAVDELVDQVIAAHTREGLVHAVQGLDRILSAHHYVIPQWHISYDRAVFWDRFGVPETYASKVDFRYNIVEWWWYDEARARRLEAAMEANQALPGQGAAP